ncbi:MAG: hypothetical protein ABIJ50_07000, partial [Pseudomonadota bacterium]
MSSTGKLRHCIYPAGGIFPWPYRHKQRQIFDLLAARDLLTLVDESAIVAPGISLRLTGGHTRGHQVLFIESRGERAVHLGDLL